VFEQYRQEVPLNHVQRPVETLPQTRGEMKALLDEEGRWIHKP